MIWMAFAVPPLGALGLLAGRRLYTEWSFGVALVLALFAAATVAAGPLGAATGAIRIYPEDAVFGALAAVAALRLTLGGQLRWRHLPWILFAATTAASFAVGAELYGFKPAGVEYRPFFYVLAGCLYGGSFPLRARGLNQLFLGWLWAAAAVLALACFRWGAEFLQWGIRAQWAGVGGMNPMRVLNAGQTLFLAQTFLATLYLSRHGTARLTMLCFSGALLAAVVLLQHRSVWVALAASGLAIAWRERAWRQWVATGLLALALGGPAYLLVSRVSANVGESLRASAEEPFDPSRSTIAWRAELWQEYVFEYVALTGVQTWLGTGFGNPAVYDVDGDGVNNAAHNYFIYTLNRAGIAGLAGLLACYAVLLHRLRGACGSWDYLGLLGALLAGQLVFSMVYGPSYEQSLLTGAALGLNADAEEET